MKLCRTIAAVAMTLLLAAPTPSRSAEPDALLKSAEQIGQDPAGVGAANEALAKRIADLKAAAPAPPSGKAAEIDALKKQVEALGKQLEDARQSLDQLENPPQTPANIPAVTADGPVLSFNKDVRHILAENCYSCHGPDPRTRKAGLRLDTFEGATLLLESGRAALVPGDPAKSELIRRAACTEESDRMPPVKTGKVMNPAQIETLAKWVAQGGKYEKHWSFVAPTRPEVPAANEWARNPIDNFVLAKLVHEGLKPSAEANRRTLLRRVTYDLTGLPPTMQEVEEFAVDPDPNAYEKAVDRLLGNPHYGEHFGRYWLDAARYADTNGYHIDNERYMWRWREYVIDAFNKNKPFDKFTIEQLAGDLIPSANLEEKMGSGFNRNHMINFEGGAIPEEYRTQYVNDRVITTGTVWMGLTVGCAQCHDHKFDPVSQKEFYQLFAFFNTVPEVGLDGRNGNAAPSIKAGTEEQNAKLSALRDSRKKAEEELEAPSFEMDIAQNAWEKNQNARLSMRWRKFEGAEAKSLGGSTIEPQENDSFLVTGNNPTTDTYEVTARIAFGGVTGFRLEAFSDKAYDKHNGRAPNGNFVLTEFEAEVAPADKPDAKEKVTFAQAAADYSQPEYPVQLAIDGNPDTGWGSEGFKRRDNRLAYFVTSRPFGYEAGTIVTVRMKHGAKFPQHGIARFRLGITTDQEFSAAKFGPWSVSGPYVAASGDEAYKTAFAPESGVDLASKYEDGRLKWIPRPDIADGPPTTLYGEGAATYLYREIQSPNVRPVTLGFGSDDGVKVWLNGEVILDRNVARGLKVGEDVVPVELKPGVNKLLVKAVNYTGPYAFAYNKLDEQLSEIPMPVELALAKPSTERLGSETEKIRAHFRRRNSPEWRELETKVASLKKEAEEFDAAIPTVMVMQEMEPAKDKDGKDMGKRESFILKRGQYDQPTDKVVAALPSFLPPMPEGAASDRLALAKWLIDPSHPLTARVTVNRFWQQFFGTGLVKTAEDFGTQGEWPSHPELLDWLATEFIQSGWDVKHMVKLIVTSAAYRQASIATPELIQRDAENRLLARGPRFRLDAEEVRDTALAVSGLLVDTIGGPSVKPYQPPGLWEEVAYGQPENFTAQAYKQDTGAALYRRSMYTFWKRQCPPPQMQVFDAPNREVCTVRRSRTNTPLQALALMNDPQYVEAARALAQRMIKEAGVETVARVQYGFQLAAARKPSEAEAKVLMDVLASEMTDFKADGAAAAKLVAIGESKRDEAIDPAELAAWTTVASMILNLDEVITKG